MLSFPTECPITDEKFKGHQKVENPAGGSDKWYNFGNFSKEPLVGLGFRGLFAEVHLQRV